MTEALPQLRGGRFVTEGGLETDLQFLHGIDLPHFAAFPLLDDPGGRSTLRRYYRRFLEIAARDGAGVVFETPTWRASADWGALLGFDADDLDRVNRAGVALLREVAAARPAVTVVASGNLGPRGDGYVASTRMSTDEAAAYHLAQIRSLAAAGADMIGALTLTYVEEAAGIVRAAAATGIPVAVAFTVETDGRLPSGPGLGEAIDAVDAATGAAACYYMVNCAHPTHLAPLFGAPGPWDRIGAIRVNASMLSHAELDEATDLDRGDPVDLAERCVALCRLLPSLTVVGGCCGTDVAHIDAISAALLAGSAGHRR